MRERGPRWRPRQAGGRHLAPGRLQRYHLAPAARPRGSDGNRYPSSNDGRLDPDPATAAGAPRGYCAGVERGGRHGRTAARAARPARLRAQADRAQHPRRAQARGARSGLRRVRAGRAGGRDLRALGTRGRARGLPQRLRAQPADGRRHLSARHEGAQGGPSLRRGRLHDLPGRARGARGGRGHQGRGARRDHARRERGRRRRARADRSRSAWPT